MLLIISYKFANVLMLNINSLLHKYNFIIENKNNFSKDNIE